MKIKLLKIKIAILSCLVGFANFLAIEAADTTQTNSNATTLDANPGNFLNGYVCGKPTNGISAGIRFFNSSQSNIMVCLFSTSQANRNQFWIAPPQFQRVEYYLYDSSHKAVPYLATYHPANKIYKASHEVPKNVYNVYEGLMASPFTMPYEENTLTDIFQIKHGGDYRLVAKGRIMKINDDGSLSLMEFPQVSILIHLRNEDFGSNQ
jgi:hypothetical protein